MKGGRKLNKAKLIHPMNEFYTGDEPYETDQFIQIKEINKPYYFNGKQYGPQRPYAKIMPVENNVAYEQEYPLDSPDYCDRNPLYTLKADQDLRIMTYDVHNWVRQCKPNFGRNIDHGILIRFSIMKY